MERGIIDLVYRTPRGCKIVDYKTYANARGAEIDALARQATDQVQTYAQH